MINTIKYTFIGLMLLIATVFIVLVYFWFNLDTLITSKRLEFVQKKYLQDLEVDWDKVKINIDSLGFFDKETTLLAKDICLNYKNSVFCFEFLNIKVLVRPLSKPIINIKELSVLSEKIIVLSEDFSKPKKEKVYAPTQDTITNSLKTLTLTWNYIPENLKIRIKASLIQKEEKDSKEIKLNLKADNSSIEASTSKVTLNLKAQPQLKKAKTIHVKGEFKTPQLVTSTNLKLSLSNSSCFMGDLKATVIQDEKKHDKNSSFYSDIKVHLTKQKTTVSLEKIKSSLPPYIDSLHSKICTLEIKNAEDNNISYNCPSIFLKPTLKKIKNEVSKKQIKRLGSFEIKSDGKFNEKLILSEVQNKKNFNIGEINFKLKETKNSLMRLNFNTKIGLLKGIKGYKPKPIELNFLANILSFSEVVDILKDSSMAIPSPLNQFNGSAYVKVNKLIESEENYILPLEGGINLKSSSKDIIDIKIDGQTKLNTSSKSPTKISSEVIIERLSLHLPNFDPTGGIPKLSSDSRIVVKEKTETKQNTDSKSLKDQSLKSKQDSIDYKFSLKTRNSHSIKLFYKLFDPYLPLEVLVKAESEGMTYTIKTIKPWSIEYLKRRVKILHFSLTKEKKFSENLIVDSELMYKASGYNIFINVVGRMDKPAVRLRSDPPLARKDIISVLLYNRTTNDLTRFQNESVGGTDSALTDKAIGLIGIWAFAATPIESVSYDSKSNIYRAQIALPAGVKFDIGTDWERIQNVTLRKRVSEYWSVVTSYEPGETASGVGNVFLQREWIF